MNIEQIISTAPDQEARRHIRRQYQKDLQVLGEREALEFARFRADALADALADANEREAIELARFRADALALARFRLIIAAIYAAALAVVIGFMISRAV